jgi:hypothetical protein
VRVLPPTASGEDGPPGPAMVSRLRGCTKRWDTFTRRDENGLTARERIMLEIVAAVGEITARAIAVKYGKRTGAKLSFRRVQDRINALEQRGLLEHRAEGQMHIYRRADS